MKMFTRGSAVAIEIAAKNVPFSTVINTLDEVLEHLFVAKKVMTG